MKRPPRSSRAVWATLAPTAGAALALALLPRWPAAAFGTGVASVGLLAVLVFTGAAGACHRPPLGGATLGLGAVALPPALAVAGAFPTACLAAASILTAELLHRSVRSSAAVQLPERRHPLRVLETTGRAALAAAGAGVAWYLTAGLGLAGASAVALGAYLLLWVALEAVDRALRGLDARRYLHQILLPPALDALAWGVGTAAVAAGRAAGWAVAGALLAALGILALEAARNALLTDLARHRIGDLEKVSQAADRMMGGGREMAAVAEQIFTQCREVLRAHWLQLELLAPGVSRKSWWSGPRIPLAEGQPEPDRSPPKLPGIHRSSPWQILEHSLFAEGVVMGRLRLWCDPRRLEPESLELLGRLLPQMGASIQRSLLDREAREDPLTGVAVRRVLERRLHEEHARCLEMGGAMAVVMCDLDHFKKINDTYGHGVGDEALVVVAGALQGDLRDSDLCARYGGEEFTLLLPGTTGEQALTIAERLRQRVEALELATDGQRVPLTVSTGVAAFPDLHVKTASELLLFADGALYEAKRRGRNRCLLDQGQGRYLDPYGRLELVDTARPAPEPPRIFA